MQPQRPHPDGSHAGLEPRQRQKTDRGMLAVLTACGLLLLVVIGTDPVPRGKPGAVQAWLQQRFGESARPEGRSSAPVAVLFHLVRTADDNKAIDALRFAAEQRLGYASPYAIERLESSNPA